MTTPDQFSADPYYSHGCAPKSVELDIPHSAEERERVLSAWDKWYATLPADLKRKLSVYDFRRLGDCFKRAFGIQDTP